MGSSNRLVVTIWCQQFSVGFTTAPLQGSTVNNTKQKNAARVDRDPPLPYAQDESY
jgi:hypothetical protein